jgi:hypothetical protein
MHVVMMEREREREREVEVLHRNEKQKKQPKNAGRKKQRTCQQHLRRQGPFNINPKQ